MVRMRIKGRHRAKKWFKPWMFCVLFYQIHFFSNLKYLHRHTTEDVKEALWEWDFGEDREIPSPPDTGER